MKTQFTEKISKVLLKKIASKDWYRHGIYRDNLFCSAIIPLGMGANFFKREGIPTNFLYIKHNYDAWITDTDMRKLTEIFYKKIKGGGVTFIKKYISGHTKDVEALLDYSYRLKKLNFKEMSDTDLVAHLEKYFLKIINTAHWLWSMEFLNPALDQHLKLELSRINKNWTEEEISDFLIKISFINEKLYFQKEAADALKYGRKLLLDDKLMKLMHNEYAWLKMYTFDGHPFTLHEYATRIKKTLADKKTLENRMKEGRKKAIQAEKMIDKIKNVGLKNMLTAARKLIYLKTYRIDIYTLSWYNAWNMIEEACSRIGINHEDISQYTPEEVVSALVNGKKIKSVELKRRKDYIILLWKEKISYLYGKAVKNIKRSIEKHDFSSITRFNGLVAQKGVVRGLAKIVLTDKDIHKIKKGDILIANLTNPNYNPAFEMIAGVVTDEGGILCHSAIMAREFGMPCIIATKIATQVLKDGDLVEVDANKGIVKIIKKA